ncbi:TlpA family protein disulfide reductase [Pengzhenrongella sicca]|uniref:Thioredoxin family protein n=1 Tax=Pengzhenrongella sicca TaxID=2819238 RepID=A0A8A4ZGV0_9MICO|nr:thioredoxin family protein [Pengzhenrongella sicca]QTE30621.1 thioredoxin family protein [Pengzhenrongella sicca]
MPDTSLAGDLPVALGHRATLLQFSSTFCAPCRATRSVLDRVARTTGGVTHVELDVADHVELGERLGIDATPMVLILDADGVERGRASGAPSLAQARAALAAVVDPS